MIDYDEIIAIHQTLIHKFGGTQGIRDKSALNAALARPFGGFGELPFYPTPEEKAAAILESIIKNHPFIDGNKRTGYVLMRLVLMHFRKDIYTTQEEKYEFVMKVASKNVPFQEILNWIKKRAISL